MAIAAAAIATLAWVGISQSDTTSYHSGNETPTPVIQNLVYTASPSVSAIQNALSFYGNQYGFDIAVIGKIAECETTLRGLCVVDTNHKLSCGIVQFQKATFERFCPNLQWDYSVNDDILCMQQMMGESGMEIVKQNWVTCSKQLNE